MNDFTKDELQMLLGGIDIYMEEICFEEKKGDPYDRLYIKLQSMIDNYAEQQKPKLIDYVSQMVKEKHKTCLTDQFDNGYFWAMKELQELLLKGELDDNQ